MSRCISSYISLSSSLMTCSISSWSCSCFSRMRSSSGLNSLARLSFSLFCCCSCSRFSRSSSCFFISSFMARSSFQSISESSASCRRSSSISSRSSAALSRACRICSSMSALAWSRSSRMSNSEGGAKVRGVDRAILGPWMRSLSHTSNQYSSTSPCTIPSSARDHSRKNRSDRLLGASIGIRVVVLRSGVSATNSSSGRSPTSNHW